MFTLKNTDQTFCPSRLLGSSGMAPPAVQLWISRHAGRNSQCCAVYFATVDTVNTSTSAGPEQTETS